MQRDIHAAAEIPVSADTGLRQFRVANNAANALGQPDKAPGAFTDLFLVK